MSCSVYSTCSVNSARNLALEAGYIGSVSRSWNTSRSNKAIPGAPRFWFGYARRPIPELRAAFNWSTTARTATTIRTRREITQALFEPGFSYAGLVTPYREVHRYETSGIRVNDGDTVSAKQCIACAAKRSLDLPRAAQSGWVALYELPFGKGRPYLSSNRFADVIVGGWQVSSLLTLQAGSPFTLRVGADQANTGRDDDRPSSTGVNANLSRGKQDPQLWFDKTQFFPAPYGTFGNVGRSTAITAGIISWDFSTPEELPRPRVSRASVPL